MSIKAVKGLGTKIGGLRFLGVVIGIILGHIIDQKLNEAWGNVEWWRVWGQADYNLTTADLATMIIGALLMFFGGRLHRFIKYIGMGILGFEVAQEIYELSRMQGSILQP